MAYKSRLLTAIPEDPGAVPGTHMTAKNPLSLWFQKEFVPSPVSTDSAHTQRTGKAEVKHPHTHN